MTTARGELAVFRPNVLSTVPPIHPLPAKVGAGLVFLVNAPRVAVLVEPHKRSDVPVLSSARESALVKQLVALATKFVAVFTVGFSSALLYSAEPADRDVIRITLPSPIRESSLPSPANRSAPVEGPRAQPSFPYGALATIMPASAPFAAGAAPAQLAAPSAAPQTLAIANLAPVRAAGDLAIMTDIAQPWRGSGLYGYVVAGPIQFVGESACRIVAVWVEAKGTPGKSIASRRCLGSDGKWNPDPAPVSTEAAGSPDSRGELAA